MMTDTSEFVGHEPCPECGSRDNLARYSDGHAFCFGCGYYESAVGAPPPRQKGEKCMDFIRGESLALPSRKITEETARKFRYLQTTHQGQPIQVAQYFDEHGQLVAQKVRTKDKHFWTIGNPNEAMPFGAHLWPRTGKMIVVTEGELDAMAMSQVQGNKFPTVSINSGAGKQTKKFVARWREYFDGFDKIVLMFDSDEPGQQAARDAAEVLGPKAHIATLPLKDPCEMLQAGRVRELVDAMWRARRYRPEGIRDLADLREQIKQRPRWGLSWWSDTLTRLTYGKRLGELVALGAGTGVGKTDFLTQDMMHMVQEHGEKIGIFALEQTNSETGIRLIGKAAKRPLHIPDYWDEEIFDRTWDELVRAGRIFLYDSFGVNEWSSIREKIRYLYYAEGVQYFYLDHLTALAAAEDDERKGLEKIMADLGGLVKEIPIHITFVSHLATPEGKPHEEGGRVMIRHFKGSRAIGYWSTFMIGLERDQQAEDPRIRQTTTVRILKDRHTGQATGQCFYLGYDKETGLLYETGPPEEASDYGFEDETIPQGEPEGDFDF